MGTIAALGCAQNSLYFLSLITYAIVGYPVGVIVNPLYAIKFLPEIDSKYLACASSLTNFSLSNATFDFLFLEVLDEAIIITLNP